MVAIPAPPSAGWVSEWDVALEDGPAETGGTLGMPGGVNLAPPLLTVGGGWRFVGDAAACGAREIRDGREMHLEFTIPGSMSNRWIGWVSQPLPIQAGRRYLFGGRIRAAGEADGAAIHAHLHGRTWPPLQYLATRPAGTGGWTVTATTFLAPSGAVSMTVHLTANRPGRFAHADVLVAEVEAAVVTTLAVPDCRPVRGLRVWTANPLVKVFRDDPPPAAAAGALTARCVRGEAESLQIVASVGGRPRKVRVSAEPLSGPSGGPAPVVEVRCVGYVPVDHPTAYYRAEPLPGARPVPTGAGVTDGWAGDWPDPLIPSAEADVADGENQPFWLTVRAGPDTLPGWYSGGIVVEADGQPPVRRLPMAVRVEALRLPPTPSLKVLLDLRTGPGGDFGYGIGAAGTEARRAWLRFLAEHRVGIDRILPDPVFQLQDGAVAIDAAAYEEEAAYCFDRLCMSAAYTPSVFYMFGWAHRPAARFGLEPLTPDYEAAMKGALRASADRMQVRGWHNRFLHYISDEPHFDHGFVVQQMIRLCRMFHDSGAGLPIYSSTWRHCPAWDDALDVWGVGQYGCFQVEEMERLCALGR